MTLLSRTSLILCLVSLSSCGDDETLNQPSPVSGVVGTTPMPAATHVACASVGGRILTFPIEQLNAMANGGRGLKLIDLEDKDSLAGAAAYTRSIRIDGIGRGGKLRDETLEIGRASCRERVCYVV